jgi:hypothetical protein
MRALLAVGAHSVASWYCTVRPDLSLNPDASPAALTRRPVGAGSFVR